MKYDYLIGMIKHHETSRIRAYSGEQQASPEHVPAAFALLMPEIIRALDENFDDVCGAENAMIIFGLQPASGMIASNRPLEQGRFIEGLQPDYHFCCTLDFFKVPLDQIQQADTNKDYWHCTDSVVVDFTSGELMDSDRFLSRLNFQPPQGQSYGYIKEDALDIAWTIAKIKQAKEKGVGFLFNNMQVRERIAEVA